MLVSQLCPCPGFPQVQGFVAHVLDMQFGDVRAMLQLPRPEIGITPACNFAIATTLCNLISGISTTLYKPQAVLNVVQSPEIGSGAAFKGLINDYFRPVP